MTSAAELFYTRRSRTGRNTESGGVGLIPSTSSTPPDHRHRYHRHQEECDPFRRSHIPPQARHICHRVSHTQRESLRLDHNTSRSLAGNSSGLEASSSRSNASRLTRNDRLPGAVLQARARLLERLRGVSLARNRQSIPVSSTSENEFDQAISDNFRFVDAGDWETEADREWLVAGDMYIEGRFHTELSSSFLNQRKTKPPGLGQEAISNLQRVVFDVAEVQGSSEGVHECCCICLERFLQGDALIRLSCGHNFHPVCLDPWVRICGDCPYCRTTIRVDFGEKTKVESCI